MGIINYGLNFQSERLQAKMLENNIQTHFQQLYICYMSNYIIYFMLFCNM